MASEPDIACKKNSNRILFPIQQGGKIGFIDNTGKIIIYPVYDPYKSYVPNRQEKYVYSDTFETINNTDSNTNIIDRTVYLPRFTNGFFPIGKDGHLGILDINGKVIADIKYSSVERLPNGGFWLTDATKLSTLISPKGSVLCSNVEVFLPMSEGLIPIQKNGYWVFIDIEGHIKINRKFKKIIKGYTNGVAEVISENGNKIVINRQGDTLLNFNMLRTTKPEDNKFNDQWGLVGVDGNFIIEPIYSFPLSFSEGISKASVNKKTYGLINYAGNFVVSDHYADFQHCTSNVIPYAVIENNVKKWGVMDTSGNVLLTGLLQSS
jgi:hypothetical protein